MNRQVFELLLPTPRPLPIIFLNVIHACDWFSLLKSLWYISAFELPFSNSFFLRFFSVLVLFFCLFLLLRFTVQLFSSYWRETLNFSCCFAFFASKYLLKHFYFATKLLCIDDNSAGVFRKSSQRKTAK